MRILITVMFVGALVPAGGSLRAEETDSTRIEFNRQVRPILSDRCFRCHGPDANHREAGLRLDTAAGATADLGGRQAVVPRKPDESELIARIISTDDAERMPPPEAGKPLTTEEVSVIRRWVEQGGEYQPHWSFIPPRRPDVPQVTDVSWPRKDVDRFVLARLEQERIGPSQEADRITLIRRVSFDLLGLPPKPAEVEAFANDSDSRAFEKLVDRLLESPHFGERMAMYWLDLVRYADTVGYHGDQEHAITPYRDWVIKAFNDNMPFDRFTIEQLAGDLLPDATIDQKIASGYNRLLQTSHEGGVQVKEYLHKYDSDRLRSLGSVWMGATLGCVECHDHKYDPYTQRDYYSLVAVFADIDDLRTFKGVNGTPVPREPELVVLSPIDRERIERLEVLLKNIEQRLQVTGAAGQTPTHDPSHSTNQSPAALREQIELLRKQTRRTMVTEAIAPKTVRILSRGDWMDETGAVVDPATPAFLAPLNVGDRRVTRLDLAKWLTSPDHPQTSRVFINRLWYLFFGNGLSNSLEDSGSQGEWPTHPELLDWLAMEFASAPDTQAPNLPLSESPSPVPRPWDIKRLVRLIVTSSAYRQSSHIRADLRERDPHNRLYARQTAFRLPAEMVRDNALAISGLLVDRVGGASARPYQPAGYYKYLNFPKREYQADSDDNQYRRGVYMHWQRTYLHPMLRAFDAPSREECTTRRPISNTPLAALTLLNDPTFVESARVFASRILREGGASDLERIRWAWVQALSRLPMKDEESSLTRLLETNRGIYRADVESAAKLQTVGLAPASQDIDAVELAAWTGVARALLNLHETVTRY